MRAWLGNSAHLWMWDEKSGKEDLMTIGFTAIRRAQYGDSSESPFGMVEDYGRWKRCLGIDCVRPALLQETVERNER